MALLRQLMQGFLPTESDEVNSIIDNLNNILNSKREYSYFLPDFGVSDYNHLTSRQDIAEAVIADVIENIEKFEPRLKLLKIEEAKSGEGFELSFKINCMVDKKALSLTLLMDPVQESYQVNPS